MPRDVYTRCQPATAQAVDSRRPTGPFHPLPGRGVPEPLWPGTKDSFFLGYNHTALDTYKGRIMKVEFIVALVGLGGVIVGALIGAGVSVWITKQQLALSYKQHKIEILQRQVAILQNGLDKISGISTDVKDANLSPDQIHSRLIDSFLQRSTIFLTFSYLFPAEFEKEIMELSGEINKLIYSAKVGQPINETLSRRIVEKMIEADKKMPLIIRKRLRLLHSELDKLISDSK